jgi:hypothetical protein
LTAWIGGTFNFIAGTLTINDGIEVGSGNLFPSSLSIAIDQHLVTPATTTIAASRTLALNGGSLQMNSVKVNGLFVFNSGILELTGGTITGLSTLTMPTNGTLKATGVYNLPVSAASGSILTATGNLTLGGSGDVSGFYSNGTVDAATTPSRSMTSTTPSSTRGRRLRWVILARARLQLQTASPSTLAATSQASAQSTRPTTLPRRS